ncbi:M23 family metallopeptidase [Patescibacteria group bacterium]|nr:M23 family metallopeptidase [Patescibacteria group bacterium]
MKQFRFFTVLAPIIVVLAIAAINGCSNQTDRINNPQSRDAEFAEGNMGPPEIGVKGDNNSTALAAKHLSLSWPFYNWTSSNGWTDYTTQSSTHVGADQYSHDLSRANCECIGIYAGISGQVVQAISPNNWNGGYGGTVVIYDWNRHVAVRYSHMRYINVYKGQWVNFRQYLGQLGHTGYCVPTRPGSTGAHLHITAYENIDHFSGGYPVIPTSRDSEHYSCMIDWIF